VGWGGRLGLTIGVSHSTVGVEVAFYVLLLLHILRTPTRTYNTYCSLLRCRTTVLTFVRCSRLAPRVPNFSHILICVYVAHLESVEGSARGDVTVAPRILQLMSEA
jgi:hypothetical protein